MLRFDRSSRGANARSPVWISGACSRLAVRMSPYSLSAGSAADGGGGRWNGTGRGHVPWHGLSVGCRRRSDHYPPPPRPGVGRAASRRRAAVIAAPEAGWSDALDISRLTCASSNKGQAADGTWFFNLCCDRTQLLSCFSNEERLIFIFLPEVSWPPLPIFCASIISIAAWVPISRQELIKALYIMRAHSDVASPNNVRG